MRILVLGINYWPEETGMAPVNTWRCEQLAARGHAVTVCTTFPYYPQWRVAEEYRGRVWSRESRNGVTILRSPAWLPARVTSCRRLLFEASFLAGNLLRAATAQRPDVLLVESPPLGLALTAFLLSRCWRAPFVFDVMDLQPDAAAELGMLRCGALLRWLYRLERSAYRHAALVFTLTEGMRQRILSKAVPPDKVAVVPLRADEDLLGLRRGIDGDAFRRACGLGGKFLVLHCGNMGVKQALDGVLQAAALTREQPQIHYLLVGDGAVRSELRARAAALELTNLSFLPVQPGEVFRKILAAADISLITQQRAVSDIVFPSKAVTLLAAGCPVIAAVKPGSEVARVVRQSGAGLVVAPEDAHELAAAVLALRRSRGLAAMSAAGRQYAFAHWNGKGIMDFLEAALLRLTARRAPACARNFMLLQTWPRRATPAGGISTSRKVV